VDTRGLDHCVTHGDILHHLTLPALHGRAYDDAAAVRVIQEGKDFRVYKVGEGLAQLLEHGDRPGLRRLTGGHLELLGR